MDKNQARNQAIDQQLAEVQKMREAKRQVQASYELSQVVRQLQEDNDVTEEQVEQLVAVLTRVIAALNRGLHADRPDRPHAQQA